MRRYVASISVILTILLLLLALGSYIEETEDRATVAIPVKVANYASPQEGFGANNTVGESVLVVIGAANTRYLRLHVYSRYVDGKWIEDNATYSKVAPQLPNVTVPHTVLRDKITVLSNTPLTQLPVFLYTLNLSVPYEYAPETGLFRAVQPIKSYTFTAVHFVIPPRVLSSLDSEPLNGYSSVNASPEVRKLAMNITHGLKSDYQKAVAIRLYLLDNYMYSVVTPKPPKGTDPLEWFLFHSRIGDSKDFNGAFVVLARLSGLSARLVSGYRIMSVPFAQQVTDSQRAYWAEVYFKGVGWIPFDSTSAVTQESRRNRSLEENLSANNSMQQMRVSVAPGQPVHVSFSDDRWIIVNGTPMKNVTLRFAYPGNYYYPVVELGWSPKVYAFSVHVTGGRVYMDTKKPVVTGLPGDNLEVGINGSLIGSYPISPYVHVISPLFSELVVTSRFPAFRAMRTFYVPKSTSPGFYPIRIVATTSYGEKSVLLFWAHIMGTVDVNSFVPEAVNPEGRTVRGGLIHVMGGAFSNEGNISYGRVYVALNKNISMSGLIIGNGTVTKGEFRIACSLPPELPVGKYYLITKVVSINYRPSTDLREIVVSARTETRLAVPSVVPAGNFTIRGAVVDDSGTAIMGNVIVSLDGSSLGTFRTSSSKGFSVNASLSPGTHRLSVFYNGSDVYLPSNASVTFRAVRLSFSPVREGEKLLVSGNVRGIKEGTLSVSTPLGIKTVSFREGHFNLSLPLNPELGAYNATFLLNGTRVANLWVDPYKGKKVVPLLSVENTSNRTVLTLQLTDGDGDPLKNELVSLDLNGTRYMIKTDEMGRAVLTLPRNIHLDLKSLKLAVGGKEVMGEGSHLNLDFLKYLLILLPLVFFVHAYSSGFRVNVLRKGSRSTLPQRIKTLNVGRHVYLPGEEIALRFEKPVNLFVDGVLFGRDREFHLKLPVGDHELRAGSKRATVHVLPPREAIVKLYEEMFLPTARKLGAKTKEATPEEIAAALIGKLQEDALREVALLFEKAKYGKVELSEDDFRVFLSALSRLGVITDGEKG